MRGYVNARSSATWRPAGSAYRLLALSKGRRAVYELGPVPVRFELTAASGGQ